MSDLRVSFPSPCGERWDDMRPDGCNRFCGACSTTIHDLSALTPEAAEALLRTPGKHCVRAEVRPDGAVVLKPSRSGRQRRIMAAVGASMSLLTAACETTPQAASPTGIIAGTLDPRSGVMSVKAVSDTGRTYRTKVRDDGSYRFKALPYGSYALKFVDECGTLDGDRVDLREGQHVVARASIQKTCVVVGMIEIQDDHG